MQISLLLEKVKYTVKKGWCREADARDADGVAVPYASPKAVAFCLMAAFDKVNADTQSDAIALGYLRKVIKTHAVACWNDEEGRIKGDVIKALDEAIELAKKDERP